MKKLLFALLAVAVSPPVFAQVSGTITSSQLVCIGVSADHSTVGVQVTGTWTGTLQPQVAIQGQALTNSQVVPSTSTTAASTITANGVYYANVGSASQFCILGNTVASGSAVVFLNAAKGVNASTLGGGGAGSGTVTNSGNLVLNNLLLGAGATSVKDYGSSVLAPANGGAANISTAGLGYFVSAGVSSMANVLGMTGLAAVAVNGSSANQLLVWQFVLPYSTSVGHITWLNVASIGSATATFGIYDSGKNKLIDSGTFNAAATANTVQSNAITTVVLPPGIYYFAQSATATTVTGLATASLNSTFSQIFNNQAVIQGTAANATVSGVMPSTLGVLTAASGVTMQLVKFEP